MKEIHTDRAPGHAGPVPQAVEAGGWVYVSAVLRTDPDSGVLPGDARDEAEQLRTSLVAILDAAGLNVTDVVRAGIYLRDLQRDRPVLNELWTRYFGEHRPARSAVEVSDF